MMLIRDAVVGWWRFFWRYAFLLSFLLLCGGFALNQLGTFCSPKSLFLLTVCLSAGAHVIASFAVFRYILWRGFRGSVRRLEIPGKTAGTWNCLRVWFVFYWRFVLFSVVISFLLGALLPLAMQWFSLDPTGALKYSKYIGNLAVPPASFLAFLFLMCRGERRRRLVLTPGIQPEPEPVPRFVQ